MSAEAQAYVEQHSPYEGTAYQVHLRLGLLANDGHKYMIFCGDEYIARMCRCSVGSVKRAKGQLVHDGFLRLATAAVGRRYAEYEFIFLNPDSIASHPAPPIGIASHLRTNSVSNGDSSPIYRIEINERDNSDFSSDSPLPVSMAQYRSTHPETVDDATFRGHISQIKKIVGIVKQT